VPRSSSRGSKRVSACANPDAIFYGKPLRRSTTCLALAKWWPGPSAFARDRHARERWLRDRCYLRRASSPNRAIVPVAIAGFGERLTHKTPTYAPDLLVTRRWVLRPNSAFAIAGLRPSEMDMVSSTTATASLVLLTLEDSGSAGKGRGSASFVGEHDLSFKWETFPANTHGGQLGFRTSGFELVASHRSLKRWPRSRARAGERATAIPRHGVCLGDRRG